MVGVRLTQEDVPAMQAFANHIAVALINARLIENLQTTKEEIEKAYNETLVGWVQALDLRDHETEDHTSRVTEITIQLARAMGVPEEKLAHVRRGALLHDIGKMAIPDTILRKPGPLSDDEWRIMRQHPELAYRWLSSIDYLVPALNIPFCHHERWDGSGYPRGLSEQEIPFEARLFAIVDVWDAMSSDRPYRKALHRDEVQKYICDQAGKQFDPQMTGAFLELINRQGEKRYS